MPFVHGNGDYRDGECVSSFCSPTTQIYPLLLLHVFSFLIRQYFIPPLLYAGVLPCLSTVSFFYSFIMHFHSILINYVLPSPPLPSYYSCIFYCSCIQRPPLITPLPLFYVRQFIFIHFILTFSFSSSLFRVFSSIRIY